MAPACCGSWAPQHGPGQAGPRPASVHRADMCGVLQCKGGQHPPGRTSCILNRVCHALTTEDGTAYELVPEGTRCGPEKVSPWLRGRATPRHPRRVPHLQMGFWLGSCLRLWEQSSLHTSGRD